MRKVQILITTHGYFAQELLKSAEMIVGNQDSNDVKTLCMTLGVDLEQFKENMREVIKEFGENRDVLILTDVIGGTPNNAAMCNMLTNSRVRAISGVNLPILLEAFTNEDMDLEVLTDHLVSSGETSVIDIYKTFIKKEEAI